MGTIEYIDHNFTDRMKILSEILEEGKKITNENKSKDNYLSLSNLHESLDGLTEKYNSILNKILYNYYTSKYSDDSVNEYHRALSKNSMPDILNEIFNNMVKLDIYQGKPRKKHKIYINLIKQYESVPRYKSPAAPKNNLKQDTMCTDQTCNGTLVVNNETSEMVCNECGMIEEIIGTVFDDVQIYHQEGSFTKHGSYERIKHGEKWLNRIQARENVEIKPRVRKDIKKRLKNESVTDVRKITYELIRECLSKTKHTKYNDHIPLIIKIITCIQPPQLTEKEYAKTIKFFDISVYFFEQTKPDDMQNCPYHPYFIRKILEQNCVLPESTYVQLDRKRRIISNIHIQSDKTLTERDIIWRGICDKIPEFVYKVTDKNEYVVPI